jgi:hypothetical protein
MRVDNDNYLCIIMLVYIVHLYVFATSKILQIFFDSPTGDDPVTLNLSTMGKGEAWVNGRSIGRYWVSFFDSKGNPSQTMYVDITPYFFFFFFFL